MPRRSVNEPGTSLFAAVRDPRPLAARMRPASLEEFVGQQHLLGPGAAFRSALERGEPGSLIIWGPPGSGKTTLAHLIAQHTNRVFVPFSAVSEGVPRLREIFDGARARLDSGDRETVLFVDEIHRLNKAQQDSLLPAVEHGTVTLVGATTENPSFELNGALLSRTRVVVLEPLSPTDITTLLQRALADSERGLGPMELVAPVEVLERLAQEADGDARRALTVLEAAAGIVGLKGEMTLETVREAMQRRVPLHDKSGEVHFNMLSAYHKSLRGSDPQGALYWMARMLEAGEDPLVLCRRAMAMAAEDIGLADPMALQIAVAARQAVHMLGRPEADLPLAEMTIYLATAPKSNAVVMALVGALDAARRTPGAAVPIHIRNAPTGLMKDLGYGADYRYAHDFPGHYVAQEYLPEELRGTVFYEPGELGYERKVRERMEWWRNQTERTEKSERSERPAEE